jgi:hypothetical protein
MVYIKYLYCFEKSKWILPEIASTIEEILIPMNQICCYLFFAFFVFVTIGWQLSRR